MTEKLEKLICALNFTDAKALVEGLDQSDIEDHLLRMCFKSASIVFYCFVLDMLKDKETAFLHYLASIILSQPLCHIEGAYQAAFFHVKKAMLLDKQDVDLKKYALFFNGIPDVLLSDEDAKMLAEELVKINLNSDSRHL